MRRQRRLPGAAAGRLRDHELRQRRATSATGHTGTITDPAWSAVAITLSPPAGPALLDRRGSGTATPAGLSPAGDAFTVSYQARATSRRWRRPRPDGGRHGDRSASAARRTARSACRPTTRRPEPAYLARRGPQQPTTPRSSTPRCPSPSATPSRPSRPRPTSAGGATPRSWVRWTIAGAGSCSSSIPATSPSSARPSSPSWPTSPPPSWTRTPPSWPSRRTAGSRTGAGSRTTRCWPASLYPVLADTAHELARAFGVLEPDGTCRRGTFVIDPEGIVRHATISDGSVGRSAAETLRVVRALRTGELCPASWQPGQPYLLAA